MFPAGGWAEQAGALVAPVDSCARSTPTVQQLATIDNASDGSFQCIGVFLEGGSVTAIRVETHRFSSVARREDSEHVKFEDFGKAAIESTRGAVLDGVPGHDAIVLKGQFPLVPGRLELVTWFLYNGFTSEYRSCRIALDRAPGNGWRLVDRLDRPVSRIMVRTREMPLIGTFGIADLEGVCF